MKGLRLFICFAIFVPAWVFICASVRFHTNPWLGGAVGAIFGIFCALAFGGSPGKKEDQKE